MSNTKLPPTSLFALVSLSRLEREKATRRRTSSPTAPSNCHASDGRAPRSGPGRRRSFGRAVDAVAVVAGAGAAAVALHGEAARRVRHDVIDLAVLGRHVAA